MQLELSAAFMENARTRPLLTGEIEPEGMRLFSSSLYATEIFWRQLHHAEFDVSEMSISSLMIAIAAGNTDWVGIPVYTMRRFFHTGIMVRTDRGISQPADLVGKTVGVPEFQQTSALWTRGVLRDEFGVQPASMQWFMERNPEQSHGGATGFTPPPGVRLQYVPRDKSLGRMLVDGELDALIHFSPGRNLIDRTVVDPLGSPQVRRLFDPQAEARRFYAKTGIFPINHCVVIRRSIVERHPWMVLSLYEAFVTAARRANERLASLIAPYAETGALAAGARQALAGDATPYGVGAARPVLETVSRYLYEDGLTKRRVQLDEVFSERTLEL
jgi:4,5-dihydroxyphthalate decarboxylase